MNTAMTLTDFLLQLSLAVVLVVLCEVAKRRFSK